MDTRSTSRRLSSDGGRPTANVVRAVAEAEGRDPTDLPPLGEAIDPDALETLLAESSGTVRISFEYAGHIVEAGSDGSVRVGDRSEE